ncbi:MAG: hypothetical protein RIK87_25635 [Fuerstiella sp.]
MYPNNPTPASAGTVAGRIGAWFAWAALLVMVVAVSGTDRSRRLPERLKVVIDNGQLQLEGNRDHRTQQTVRVKAGVPVQLIISSSDFVYTVQQPDTNTSVVVLPGRSATMTVQVNRGSWPIQTMPGCGGILDRHQPLILEAVR